MALSIAISWLLFIQTAKLRSYFCKQLKALLSPGGPSLAKNQGYAKVGYIYLEKTTSQRVARMLSWNTIYRKQIKSALYMPVALVL